MDDGLTKSTDMAAVLVCESRNEFIVTAVTQRLLRLQESPLFRRAVQSHTQSVYDVANGLLAPNIAGGGSETIATDEWIVETTRDGTEKRFTAAFGSEPRQTAFGFELDGSDQTDEELAELVAEIESLATEAGLMTEDVEAIVAEFTEFWNN